MFESIILSASQVISRQIMWLQELKRTDWAFLRRGQIGDSSNQVEVLLRLSDKSLHLFKLFVPRLGRFGTHVTDIRTQSSRVKRFEFKGKRCLKSICELKCACEN